MTDDLQPNLPKSAEQVTVRRPFKRFVWVIVWVFIAAVLLFVLYPLLVPDAPQVELKSRVPGLGEPAVVPDGENGFEHFSKAGSLLKTEFDEVEQNIFDGLGWDLEVAGSIVDQNREAIEEFRRATECDFVQCPEVRTFYDELPYISKWMELSKVLVVQAKMMFKIGNEKGAFDLLLDVLRFGDMVSRDSSILITYLVGLSIKGRAVDAMAEFLPDSNLDEAAGMELICAVEKYKGDGGGLGSALSGEYRVISKTVGDLGEGLVDLDGMMLNRWYHRLMLMFLYKPNATRLLFYDAFVVYYENAGKSYFEIDFSTFPEVEQEGRLAMYLSGNAFGKMLHAMVMPAFHQTFAASSRIAARISAFQVLCAMKPLFDAEGRLPATLDELMYPEGILPVDPFSGKPFIYLSGEGMFYSVGPNGDEDNGNPEEDEVFEIRYGRNIAE